MKCERGRFHVVSARSCLNAEISRNTTAAIYMRRFESIAYVMSARFK